MREEGRSEQRFLQRFHGIRRIHRIQRIRCIILSGLIECAGAVLQQPLLGVRSPFLLRIEEFHGQKRMGELWWGVMATSGIALKLEDHNI